MFVLKNKYDQKVEELKEVNIKLQKTQKDLDLSLEMYHAAVSDELKSSNDLVANTKIYFYGSGQTYILSIMLDKYTLFRICRDGTISTSTSKFDNLTKDGMYQNIKNEYHKVIK